MPNDLQAAAIRLAKKGRAAGSTKKYKGKYIGPDKYKGVAQQGKKKFKGKYAGPDKYKGMVPTTTTKKWTAGPKGVKPIGAVAPEMPVVK